MKLVIDRDVLAVALGRVAPIVQRNSPIPILACVKLAALGPSLLVTGQGGMAEASQTCAAIIERPGALCLAADKLTALVGTLAKGSQIEIEQTSETRVMIRYGKGHAAFPALDAEAYPVMAFKTEREPFTIDAAELRRLFEMTLPFVSVEETRPYLCGLHIHGEAVEATGSVRQWLRTVTTDGSGMVIATAETDAITLPPGITVPTAACVAVSRILNGADGEVIVSASDHGARFDIGSCTFTTRLIDGTFPDYRRVLPPTVPDPVIVSGAALREVTERAQAITEAADATKARPRSIRLTCTPGKTLLCTAGSEAEQHLNEEIDRSGGETSTDTILGTAYLLDAIKALGDGDIQLHISAREAAVLIRRDRVDDPESVTLMPRRG